MQSITGDCALDILVWLLDKSAWLCKSGVQEQDSYVNIFDFLSDSLLVVFNGAQLREVEYNASCFYIVLLLKQC